MNEIREKGQSENFSGQFVVQIDESDGCINIHQFCSHYGESNCSMPYINSIRFPQSMVADIVAAITQETT